MPVNIQELTISQLELSEDELTLPLPDDHDLEELTLPLLKLCGDEVIVEVIM